MALQGKYVTVHKYVETHSSWIIMVTMNDEYWYSNIVIWVFIVHYWKPGGREFIALMNAEMNNRNNPNTKYQQ